MGKFLLGAIASLLMSAGSGCTLCPSCDLDSYAAYGGRWQRTDRDDGLVASVFVPAGVMVPYEHAAEELDTADILDRPETEELDADDPDADDLDVEELDDEALDSELFDSIEDEPVEQEDSVLEPLLE